jgi:hypothetical protein
MEPEDISCLDVIIEVGAANLWVDTLLVQAPFQDLARVARGVHASGVPHQHNYLHTAALTTTIIRTITVIITIIICTTTIITTVIICT